MTTSRFFMPRASAFDGNGDPISGAKLYFYDAGTSTPRATYSDSALSIANTNPVEADSAGRFPDIFLTPSVAYKVAFTDAADAPIWTADPYQPEEAASTPVASATGLRNAIVNGDFAVNQRGISASSIADDTYWLDRWIALQATGNVTASQQSLQANGIPTNGRLLQPDVSAKRLGTAQIVEAANCQWMRGSQVVLSAKVRCSSTATIRMAILTHTGTADAVTSDVVNNWASGSYTAGNFFDASMTVNAVGSDAVAANTWTTLTPITATLGSSVNNVIVFIWSETQLAQNATLDFATVQFELGATPTNFEYVPYYAQIAACQRYYVTAGRSVIVQGFNSSAAWSQRAPLEFPVEMRVAPTPTIASLSSNTNVASATVEQVGRRGCTLVITSSGAGGFFIAYDDITFAAEL